MNYVQCQPKTYYRTHVSLSLESFQDLLQEPKQYPWQNLSFGWFILWSAWPCTADRSTLSWWPLASLLPSQWRRKDCFLEHSFMPCGWKRQHYLLWRHLWRDGHNWKALSWACHQTQKLEKCGPRTVRQDSLCPYCLWAHQISQAYDRMCPAWAKKICPVGDHRRPHHWHPWGFPKKNIRVITQCCNNRHIFSRMAPGRFTAHWHGHSSICPNPSLSWAHKAEGTDGLLTTISFMTLSIFQ